MTYESSVALLVAEKERLQDATRTNWSEGRYYRDRAQKYNDDLAELDEQVIAIDAAIAVLERAK